MWTRSGNISHLQSQIAQEEEEDLVKLSLMIGSIESAERAYASSGELLANVMGNSLVAAHHTLTFA